ncbi:MAG: hypothetical protein R3181_00340 [Rubricoccaceae bacterium]|nr:hypothetical protein [Rubricoccaceae bacterium]
MEERSASEGAPLLDPDAVALLERDPFALLLGVLLDQQVRAETAFEAPHRLKARLGHLDPSRLAAMDDDAVHAVFAEKPALHRYPKMMARRARALAGAVSTEYRGDASEVWSEGDEKAVRARAGDLPGFGPAKVDTLVHALALFGHRRLRST